MRARVYVWVEGEKFSPSDFQRKLNPDLAGTIEYRKKLRDGVVQKTREHWKSPVYETNDHKEAVRLLADLVSRLRPALSGIQGDGTLICAELVFHYRGSSESHGGAYLPHNVIELLADVGMSLDIDEYYE